MFAAAVNRTYLHDVSATAPVLQAVLRELPLPVLRANHEGFIIGLSPACEQLFGVHADDVLGYHVSCLLEACSKRLLKPDQEQHLCLAATAWANGVRGHRLPLRRRGSGDNRHLSVNTYFVGDSSSFELFIVLDELNPPVDVPDPLPDKVSRFQTLTRLAPVGILELDAHWNCLYANDKWTELSRLGIDESAGSGWIDAMHPADVSDTLVALYGAVQELESHDHELRLQSPLGEITRVSMKATALFDNHQRVTGILVVANDITERHRANQELRRLALQDTLTGLYNREAFLQALREALTNSARPREVSVLFLDLDEFKAVNDTLGHHAGDMLLKQVAQRVQQQTSEADIVARLGGDEFTVLINRHDVRAYADGIATDIVNSLKEPFLIDGQQVRVSTSIGIAVGDDRNIDEELLLRQADVALYRAKHSGRAQHVFYLPELDQARKDQSVLISRISGALDEREFEVYYQPQLDIRTGELVGLEALLRWPIAEFPNSTTEDYIKALENNGLIGPVGNWVLQRACTDWRSWRDAGLISRDVRLSINVSARQLAGRHFLSQFHETLTDCQAPADLITVEITESTAISHRENGVIDKLKELGVSISIDDFGTGFSSLSYLSHLPADEIKIDKSFIRAMQVSERAGPLVSGILALAKSLGLSAVAEGVEDAAILPELEAAGCNTVQGYLYSAPLSANDLHALLTQDGPSASPQRQWTLRQSASAAYTRELIA